MSRRITSLVDELRQPEYTGPNRCLPCTVVNTALAAAVSVLVATTVSVGAGTGALAVCGIAIYLRGYLIPKTPTLTKRYFPDRIHRLFGTHHVDPADVEAATAPSGVAADELGDASDHTSAGDALLAEGVVVDSREADDLRLDPTFRDVWRHRIEELRESETGTERLAAHLDVDPDAIALEERDDEYAMLYEGGRVDGWPSRAAFLADLAVEPTLSEWCPEWESYEPGLRTEIIAGLRAFLERCPACDADLETAESAWETCCREGTDVTVACDACGDVVFFGRY